MINTKDKRSIRLFVDKYYELPLHDYGLILAALIGWKCWKIGVVIDKYAIRIRLLTVYISIHFN